MPDVTSSELGLLQQVARALHANGQQSDETIRTVEEFGRYMGGQPRIVPGWDGLILQDDRSPALPAAFVVATPSSIAMNCVAGVSAAVEDVIAGRLSPEDAVAPIRTAATLPPSSNAMFALACASGATALSVTFGVAHLSSVILIFLSAGAGGYLRRWAGLYGGNAFVQAFLAAALSGLIGACAVHYQISSDLRLIAVCPCMVLVPGPHLLNGTSDLLAARIQLGASRMLFAMLILASISTGLLISFASLGVTLPAVPVARAVSLWPIVIAAGVAAASYSVFYSLPMQLLGWPIGTAIVADTFRWMVITHLQAGAVVGAGVAGLVAGVLLIPIARRHHIPFAGIGFASIVSLMPGVLVFRMMGGILELQTAGAATSGPLLSGTISDGMTAALVIAAMTSGVVSPKHAFDAFQRHRLEGKKP